MKKITFILVSFLAVSCVDSLEDYSVNQKKATVVPPVGLFNNALKNITDGLTTPNVNVNNFRFYVQYWTATTYVQEPRYDLTSRLITQNWWQGLYTTALADLREAKRLVNLDAALTDDVRSNQLAQLEVMEIFAWSTLLNTFGDIPYSKAFDVLKPLASYDDAATIYADLLTRLDAALPLFNNSASGMNDILYSGSISKWLKFGNSLKLKLAMIIADVDNTKARQLVEAAAPNVFTDNADNARFGYLSSQPNNNPISTALNPLFTSRGDYIAANTFVDKLNSLNDPRLPFYFTRVSGVFVGGLYGFTNTYSSFSHVSDKVIAPTFEGLLLDYAEVEFLLAEAAERGYTLAGSAAGTAPQHYAKAIQSSILYWGGTQADVDTYLAQPAVDYATAGSTYREKIGVQKWIALYNRGFEAWTEWRRLDYPLLLPPTGGNAPVGLIIPVRLTYPVNEQTLNNTNWRAASDAMGGDLTTSKLFWDVN